MAPNGVPGEEGSYQSLVKEGLELARAELTLKGAEAEAWSAQYADGCRRTVSARIKADGGVFVQALVFPLFSMPSGGLLLPLPGHALHVVAELEDGMLVYFRLWERSPSGLRLGEFLGRIAHCFDKSARAATQLAELERCSKTALARRIVYRDFPLAGEDAVELFNRIPNLMSNLTELLFSGFPGVPYLGKKAVRDTLGGHMARQFAAAHASFVRGLKGDVLRTIGDPDELTTILDYNQSLLESRRPRRRIVPAD